MPNRRTFYCFKIRISDPFSEPLRVQGKVLLLFSLRERIVGVNDFRTSSNNLSGGMLLGKVKT